MRPSRSPSVSTACRLAGVAFDLPDVAIPQVIQLAGIGTGAKGVCTPIMRISGTGSSTITDLTGMGWSGDLHAVFVHPPVGDLLQTVLAFLDQHFFLDRQQFIAQGLLLVRDDHLLDLELFGHPHQADLRPVAQDGVDRRLGAVQRFQAQPGFIQRLLHRAAGRHLQRDRLPIRSNFDLDQRLGGLRRRAGAQQEAGCQPETGCQRS